MLACNGSSALSCRLRAAPAPRSRLAAPCRYRSNKLHWDFAPHKGPSTFDVAMAPGRICITARQPLSKRKLVLTLEAPLPTFSRVQVGGWGML